jgi:Flp pilus assembly pilin Flp
MFSRLRQWITECEGATAIEYGLLLAAVALAILLSVTMFGENLSALFYDRLPTILDGE